MRITKKNQNIIIIVIVLLFSINALAEIDHIHFGSIGNPLQGLTISWRGNYSHCRIKWGYTPDYEKGITEIEGRIDFGDKNYYLFDYRFDDLKSSTTIHYAFQEYNCSYDSFNYIGEWTKDFTFQTSSDIKSQRFTFIAGGDSRGESCTLIMPGWQKVADALKTTNADFYLYMGDLVNLGGDKNLWNTWYGAGRDFLSQKLVYYSPGNHEAYGDPGLNNYLNQLTSPENGDYTELYYSFEFGNAVFININTEFETSTPKGRSEIKKQTQWLAAQLEKYRGPQTKEYKEWVVISFHKPFFTVGKHMGEMTGKVPSDNPYHDFSKTWWEDLFDKYGVDLIINGHTHLYMRSKPLLLVGAGPAGKDITFDPNGLPSTPAKTVKYGNKKGEGRLQIVTAGYGVNLLNEDSIKKLKNQWYVDNYKLEFHYCEFVIDGKVLDMKVKKIPDNTLMDQVTITH